MTEWSSTRRIEAFGAATPTSKQFCPLPYVTGSQYKARVEAANTKVASRQRRPTVLVVATPYVLATALAFALTARGRFDVVAPDLRAGELMRATGWDVVVRTAPDEENRGGIAVQLPTSFKRPVLVTMDETTVPVMVSTAHPVADLIALLEELLFHD